MNTLDWFNNRSNRQDALVPDDISLNHKIKYAIYDSSTNGILDDAPPKPSDKYDVLLIAVYDNRVAYYWIPDRVLDDVEMDIWAEVRPSIFEQLGLKDAR